MAMVIGRNMQQYNIVEEYSYIWKYNAKYLYIECLILYGFNSLGTQVTSFIQTFIVIANEISDVLP
jgi:hypothetical protein